jgi:hypothetical protein
MESEEKILQSEIEINGSSTNYNNAINQPQLFAAVLQSLVAIPDAPHHQIQQQEDQDTVAVVQQNVDLKNNIVEPQVQQHIEMQAVADIQQQMGANIPNAEFVSTMEQRANVCIEEVRRRGNNLQPDMDTAVAFQV